MLMSYSRNKTLSTSTMNASLLCPHALNVCSITSASSRLPHLASPVPAPRPAALKHLTQLERRLTDIDTAIPTNLTDTCSVQQLKKELADLRSDLRSVFSDLAALSLEEDDDAMRMEKGIRHQMYDCSVKIRKLLSTCASTVTVPSSATSSTGVKLPKIDIPRFDSNILGWRTFWEQFRVSIHNRTSLSKAEKLAYLYSSLKYGSARSVVEGLTQSSDQYVEAMKA